jgi:hypothetical protein
MLLPLLQLLLSHATGAGSGGTCERLSVLVAQGTCTRVAPGPCTRAVVVVDVTVIVIDRFGVVTN